MNWSVVIFLAVCWAITLDALVGAYIGSRRDRTRDGLALGAFLGFIGFAIIALMQPTEEYKIAMARDALRIQALAAAPPAPRKPKPVVRSWMEEPEAFAP
jgi:hypothetical protein